MSTTSVYITVPNGTGYVHKLVHAAIFKMYANSKGYKLRHDLPTHTPITQNRHKCMWDFLNGGEDYWLSIDDDNPPIKNPLDLVEFDCDVVGLPTPVWHSEVPGDRPWYFNALKRVGNGYRPVENISGLQEVDAIGSGCFLVSRRVMLKLCKQQPFARQWNEDGLVTKGGDYSFCDKVKAAGFRIFANFDYPCRHFSKDLDVLTVVESFHQMIEKHEQQREAVLN